jgi:DNA-binding protein HU-beta
MRPAIESYGPKIRPDSSLTSFQARGYDGHRFHGICCRTVARAVRTQFLNARHSQGDEGMADARRMGKMELFAHFADKFEMKRTSVRDLFDELNRLSEKELKRSGEFVLPGICKLVVQKRKAREGRNPATGEPIKIPAKTVVKARIAKQLKDAVLPRK